MLTLFLYLQVLDLMTTLVGFKLGAGEASPFIRLLMRFGPEFGVVASKVVAVGLAGACLYLGKGRLLRWANIWYACLIVWNLGVILSA